MRKVDYIFSINTGRAGSQYLTRLFEHVEDACSVHEPEPICNGQAMRKFLVGDTAEMEALTKRKVENLELARGKDGLYVETNHCFVDGFGWVLPKHLDPKRMGIVVLKRDKKKITSSRHRIKTTPITTYGREWIASPQKKSPAVEPPRILFGGRLDYALVCAMQGVRSVHRRIMKRFGKDAFEMPGWVARYEQESLDWYVEEVWAQAELYREKFPDVLIYEVDIDELNTGENVLQLLDFFGCTPKASMSEAIGVAVNLKKESA